MADIFISYTTSDRDWAFWIATELKSLGHTAHVHEWEIKGGEDIYAWMEDRHDAADHVLCVVSDEYLKAPYSTLERNAALWQAAAKRQGFVLFIAVKPCKLPTLSDHIRRCELFGVPEDAAQIRFREFMEKRVAPEAAAFPGKVFAVSNITIRVPTHFMGREDSLGAIATALARYEGRVAITALHGLRGVGKTTLAAAYAESHRSDYRATWWIRAQTESTMRADIVSLGVRLEWVKPQEKEEPAFAAVMERIRHEGEGILLIYDNAPDSAALGRFLPRGGASRVLVTSNAHAWRGVAEPVEIRLWPKEIGADYLIVRTGRQNERDAALALSDALGGLPLAHEQAGAYCERLGLSLAEYRRRFEAAPARMLDDERDAPAEYHDRLTAAKTFALAIDEAAKLHPAAEPLIVHASLLAPEPIPLFIFAEGRKRFDRPLATQLAGDGLDEAVAALRAFALVERESIPDERDTTVAIDCIRLHRLVRQIAAHRCEGEAQQSMLGVLIRIVAAIYPKNVSNNPKTWPRARRLDRIALELVGEDVTPPPGAEQPAADVLSGLALYRYGATAAYERARSLFERALMIRERALGPEHPITGASLNNLAFLLQARSELANARPLFERALAIKEKALGPKHPSTGTSLNNLALLLQNQGDFAGARPLYERALAIREEGLGPEHPDTAASLSNLARLLQDMGDTTGALPLAERALAIREKVLGPEHPDTAASLNNIARLHQDEGKNAAALPLHRRALAIRENALGPEHPHTAQSLNNLAVLLQAQGDLAAARPLCERALAIRQKVLGPEHPDTALSLAALARLLTNEGDLSAAKALSEKVLAISMKAFGTDHPDTNRARRNLGRLLLLAGGEPAEALTLAEAALAAHGKVLGANNLSTKASARVTADALDVLGRGKEAEALRERYGIERRGGGAE